MKKFLFSLGILVLLICSSNALAGLALGQADALVTPNPTAQPNSHAYGNSPEAWVEAHLRWMFEEAAVPGGNVTFLPIIGESPFYIPVKPGMAMVLPIALYLGFAEDSPLGVENFYGVVTLDGQPIAEPNVDYYIDPTDVDPPILGLVTFIEGLAVIINPLTPGAHTITLYSTVTAPEDVYVFNNTWYITVAP